MVEPATTSAVGLGLLGGFLSHLPENIGYEVAGGKAHRAYEKLSEKLRRRLLDGTLPVNDHLLHALHKSLGAAALVFAYSLHDPDRKPLLDLLSAPRGWLEFFDRCVELIQRNIIEERPEDYWLSELISVAKRPENFQDFDLKVVLDDNQLSTLIRESVDSRFRDHIHNEFLHWADRHVTISPKKPPNFHAAIRDGLSLTSNSGQRLNFYQVFCHCLREELKEDTHVHRAYVIDILAELKSDLDQLAMQIGSAEDRKKFIDAIETLKSFPSFQAELDRQSKELLIALAPEFAKLHSRHDRHDQILSRIDATTGRTEQRLEHFQAAVLGRHQPLARPPFHRLKRAQAGEFFGRRSLLVELTARLSQREDVYIWGPAGMGKTAIAAEALCAIIGEDDASLAYSPFCDGIVVLDLYQLRADTEKAWDHLATSFAPDLPTNQTAEQRARTACLNRRALIVVEGAEEAHDADGLQRLLAVLSPENRRLVLTRNKAQVVAGQTLELDHELSQGDSIALLDKLATNHRVNDTIFTGLYERLGGHPLALTWAGSQLAAAEESPQFFLHELEEAALPRLHEQGFEHRTLRW